MSSNKSSPKVRYLAITPTLCGGPAIGSITFTDKEAEPELYDIKADWIDDQADALAMQIEEVRCFNREPNEVGVEEELVMVLVYEDGRIIDACDLLTDYRVIWKKQAA